MLSFSFLRGDPRAGSAAALFQPSAPKTRPKERNGFLGSFVWNLEDSHGWKFASVSCLVFLIDQQKVALNLNRDNVARSSTFVLTRPVTVYHRAVGEVKSASFTAPNKMKFTPLGC